MDKTKTVQEALKSSMQLFMAEETKTAPRIYSYGPLSEKIHLCPLPEEIANPENRKVKVASVGVKHFFLLLDNGVLLCSGKNDCGQLGIDPELYDEPNDLIVHPTLNYAYEVENVACGNFHSVFIVREKSFPRKRHVLTCGHKGQLGV